MKNDVLFHEEQKFKQWWVWVPVILIFAFLVYRLYSYLFIEKNTNNTLVFIFILAIFSLIFILFFLTKLETEIKEDGIYVRFFPIQLHFKKYDWDTISKCFVRTYSPLQEYGGWGMRYSLSKRGNALNISGNKGLQLEFESNKKLLIGTNKADELEKILTSLGKIKV